MTGKKTVEELLDTVVPLPLSGPGFGPIRTCLLEDLVSARGCIDRNPQHYSSLIEYLPILDRLIYRLKRDSAANTCEDLRYFALKTAITGPNTSKKLRNLTK